MEILLSFSENPELIEYLAENPVFITHIIRTIDKNNKLSLKALIFLLNISAREQIAKILAEKKLA